MMNDADDAADDDNDDDGDDGDDGVDRRDKLGLKTTSRQRQMQNDAADADTADDVEID